jgi:beta-glucosidase
MKGRTYKYFTGKALFPFGFGLSYAKFQYLGATFEKPAVQTEDTASLTVVIKNNGDWDGDEVIQVYAGRVEIDPETPIKKLVAFKRVHFKKGEEISVKIPLAVKELRTFQPKRMDYWITPGIYPILIGASSADIRLTTNLKVLK